MKRFIKLHEQKEVEGTTTEETNVTNVKKSEEKIFDLDKCPTKEMRMIRTRHKLLSD